MRILTALLIFEGRMRALLFTAVFLLAIMASYGAQQAGAQNDQIGFEAENVSVNQEDGSLHAIGGVIMRHAGAVLTADEVRYDRQAGKASARGNVVLVDRTGITHKAAAMQLDAEFTHIIAESLSSQFPDGSFFIAKTAEIDTAGTSVFTGSRFSPCECMFEDGETPIWDLRTSSSRRDAETGIVEHRNVRMHILNIPVAYLPYLAHPDWTVRRKSGLLTPSLLVSEDLGATVSTPYFLVIDDTSDVEVTPYSFQRRGEALVTRYRKKWDRAELDLSVFSANVHTYKSDREEVAAIDGKYSVRMGDGWDVNMRLRRASQDTFMRRYRFSSDTVFKSEIQAERIKSNRYYRVEMSDVQGLEIDDTPEKEPTILPLVFYEKVGPGFRPGQTFRREISAFQLDNDDAHDMARWTANFELSENGQIGPMQADFAAGVIASYYTVHKIPDRTKARTGDITRVTPQALVGLRYPIALTMPNRIAIIEPRLQFVYVGGEDRTEDIPNRDSTDYRVDEANLFLLNRYQGYDYLRPGARADVGVSVVADGAVMGRVTGFVGASYRLSGKPSTGLAVNEKDALSDYVASFSLDPDGPFHLSWFGRMESNNYRLNESKTTVKARYGLIDLSFEHLQLAQSYFANAASDLEEMTASFTLRLGDDLSATGTQVWDLSNGSVRRDKSAATLSWVGGIQNCFSIDVDYERSVETDRDVPSGEKYLFTFNFKYLGSFTRGDLLEKASN